LMVGVLCIEHGGGSGGTGRIGLPSISKSTIVKVKNVMFST